MQITKNDNAANSVILDDATKCSAPLNEKAEAHSASAKTIFPTC